jgi:hypothetical protein
MRASAFDRLSWLAGYDDAANGNPWRVTPAEILTRTYGGDRDVLSCPTSSAIAPASSIEPEEVPMRCEPVETPLGARPATGKLYCVICGCTDDRACPGGCHWVSKNPPMCSACVPHQALERATAPWAHDAAEQMADDDNGLYGAERCPASATPAAHVPIYVDETTGYCVRCRQGFVT